MPPASELVQEQESYFHERKLCVRWIGSSRVQSLSICRLLRESAKFAKFKDTRSHTKFPLGGAATALGERGVEEGEHVRERQLLADCQLALGTFPGVERARLHAAPAARPESDHHTVAEGERSVCFFFFFSLSSVNISPASDVSLRKK